MRANTSNSARLESDFERRGLTRRAQLPNTYRSDTRARVEALTVRETRGEAQRLFRSTYPVKGGLVSSMRYILECVHEGREPWRA